MLSALAQLAPLAIAAALSTVPITATILILVSPQRSRSALPFLIGWVSGMALVVLGSVLGAGALPQPDFRPSPTVIGAAEVIVGLALLLYGLVAAWRAVRKRPLSSTNRWLGTVSSFGPLSSFGLALALNLRPKGLLIGMAAGLAITGASVIWADSLILIGSYLVLAVSTVAVPIVVTLVAPGRMEPRLLRIRDWLERNGAMVTAFVMSLIGIVIALAGLIRLVQA